MNDYFNESNNELVTSEQLKPFVIVENFCESCGQVTPHHLDESQTFLKDEEYLGEDEVEFVKPISLAECTLCREEEEAFINNFDA